MVRRRLAVAAAALLAAGAGCSKPEEPPKAGETPQVVSGFSPEGEEVALVRSFPGAQSGGLGKESRLVLRDAKSWAETWARANSHVAPVPKAPAVDFPAQMVALFALGEKPTGGWSVEVVGARKIGGKLRLLYAVREPAPDSMAPAVVTHPWHAVVLPASDLPVEWVRYEAPKPPVKPR